MTVAFVGVLNVVHIISRASLTIFLATGLFAVLVCFYRHRSLAACCIYNLVGYVRLRPLFTVLAFMVCCLMVLRYALAVSSSSFNQHDDYQGYCVFPLKMIQTGTLGPDPFSERRIVSSLGGQAAIDAFILAYGGLRNLHLGDSGVAFLAFIILVFSWLREQNVSVELSLLITSTAILTQPPVVNISAMYTSMVLVLLLIRMMCTLRAGLDTAVVIGLVAAATCSLKHSLVPVVALFTLCYLPIIGPTGSKPKILVQWAAIICILVLLMLPWMIASYQSSGTPLYPLLGKGFHGSVYGTFLTPTAKINLHNVVSLVSGLQSVPCYVFGSLLCLVIFQPRSLGGLGFPLRYLFWSSVAAFACLSFVAAGYGTDRYSFPFIMPLILAFAISIFSDKPFGQMLPLLRAELLILVAVAMLTGVGLEKLLSSRQTIVKRLSFGLRNMELFTPATRERYAKLQAAVPVGDVFLARLDVNCLFDFRRNSVFIADYPGGASLPPGMPLFKGPELLAQYLLEHSIRYVAFSYVNEAMFTRAEYSGRLDVTVNAWIRSEAECTFDFQKNLQELGRSRKRIFDDGNMFVLDLANVAGFN